MKFVDIPRSWAGSLAPVDFGAKGTTATGALLHGAGATNQAGAFAKATAGNFLSYFLSQTATSGTTRGQYLRLYLGAAAGQTIGDGEALRAFTTINGAAVAQGIHGAHVSVNFGANGSNSGETAALRGTFQAPNRALPAGTYSALYGELYGDGADTDALAATEIAFARFVQAGTFKSGKDANIDLFTVEGVTDGAGNVFRSDAPGAAAASLRIKVNGTPYYISLSAAQA